MNPPEKRARPLSPAERAFLVAGATTTILAFYIFIGIAAGLMLGLLTMEALVTIAALRVGAAGHVRVIFTRHAAMFKALLRSLWIKQGIEFLLELKPEDAPALFEALEEICRNAGIAMPSVVALDMSCNASVRMDGWTRGSRKTRLLVGYDLMAGLTVAELKGVLAHEVTHAKLIQRGFHRFLHKGLLRARRAATKLGGLVEWRLRDRIVKSTVARLLLRPTDWLTRLAARQVAAWSRQAEFEADRGAAELTSAEAMRAGFLKLEGLNQICNRLAWRERVAQLESGGGFSEWLVQELAAAPAQSLVEVKPTLFNRYSTHPSIKDRLEALEIFPHEPLMASPPAVSLLAKPDDVAAKLVEAIQKTVVLQEKRDSKELDRWSKHVRPKSHLTEAQGGVIVGMAIVSVIAISLWATYGFTRSSGAMFGVFIVVMTAALRGTRYRDQLNFPIPDYALIKEASLKKVKVTPESEKALEEEFAAAAERAGATGKKRRAAFYVREGYAALEKCDYVRAHVAGRLCLKQEKGSVAGALILAVAGASIKQNEMVSRMLRFVNKQTGMRGPSVMWGNAWALQLAGDWQHAEACMESARKLNPGEPTLLALMAVSQLRRNKLLSAIASARQACLPEPRNDEYVKLLVELLLVGGFLREAAERAKPYAAKAMEDPEWRMIRMRSLILQHEHEAADAWAEQIKSREGIAGDQVYQVGLQFEHARRDDKAEEFFQHAMTLGHYPEALLALGRIAARKKRREEARKHLLGALDLKKTHAEKSPGPLQVFGAVLQEIRALEEPIENAEAWIAEMPKDYLPTTFGKGAFFMYARNQEEAQGHLETILAALQPETARPQSISWRLAPKEQQPEVPVQGGVQMVMG